MSDVKQFLLWSVLREKGTNEQRAMVEYLVAYAAGLLDRVVETFPTYTLHTAKHAGNVAELMAELLGDQIDRLSALEAALLILSAYYHDIGMVFKPDERGELVDEQPHWDEFLDTFPDAYVAVQEAEEVPIDIAEWYCRWRHADRVFSYLNQMSAEDWCWDVIDIREDVGALCKSHNDKVADLQALDNDYLAQADLQFCAILLRVADILDFDRSRSPESVYNYLGLARRDTPRERMSDVEWRKHLCSDGFKFPEDRSSPYSIQFIAGPNEPAVEHDVRQFLDVIEDELTQCNRALQSCSDRWRDFVLPDRVDRSNIRGSGYRYGEYRFTLKQDDVLDLLVGENLYEDSHVFVRELLQNAIDTARHREHYERYVEGRESFEIEPVQVSEWRDRDGYRWVRFDDWGMGMDLDIIHDHFLKIGSSYYKTARFKAEMLRARDRSGRDFVPVSRFGIGVLSCFLAGDRVEVSTHHRDPNAEPVRLSLRGLHGFYTVQTPNLRADPMPSPDGVEKGYRRKVGTSIAVRLDPHKERGILDLGTKLDEYLLCPPVSVEFEGEHIGGDPTVLLDEPWCEHTVVGLSPEMMEQIEEALGHEFERPLQLEIVPIDLTNHAYRPEVKGQFVAVSLRPSREWFRYVQACREDRTKDLETLIVCFKRRELVIQSLGDITDITEDYGLTYY